MRSFFQGFVRSGAAVASLLLTATLAFAQASGGAGGAGGATGGATGAAGGTSGAAGGTGAAGSGVTAPNVGGAAPATGVNSGGTVPGVRAPGLGIPGATPGIPGVTTPGGTSVPGVQAPGIGGAGNTVAPGVQAPGLPAPNRPGPSLNPSLPNSGPVTPGATSPASGNVSTPNSPAAPAGSSGGTGSRSTGVANPGIGSTATPGSGIANPNATTLPNGTALPGSAATGNGVNPVNRGQLGFSVRSGAGEGLVVSNVNTGGLAQQAGLLAGDQIVSINGNAVNSQADISTALRQSALSGNNVLLGVRRNGQLQSINVNAGSGTSSLGQAGAAGSTAAGQTPTTSTLPPGATQVTTGFRGFGEGLTFGTSQTGLSITDIRDNSWATQAGFLVGDQIVSIDGQPVSSQAQFPTQLQGAIDRNGFANVIVNRNGRPVPLRVAAPAGATGFSTGGQVGAIADFGGLAGDFNSAFTAAGTSLQAQMAQMNSLNERVRALQTALANPPTDAAGRAQVLDQLRTLRAEINALNNQTNLQFFQQLEQLRARLNDFNPTFNQATATGSASGPIDASTGTPNSPGTPNNPGASGGPGATTRGATPPDRTVIGGRSSDTSPSNVTAPTP